MSGLASARKRDVKILKLNSVLPSFDNIRAGKYPLYRPLYLVTNPRNAKQPLISRFVQFAYSARAKAFMRSNGVVPYNDALHLVMKELSQQRRSVAPN